MVAAGVVLVSGCRRSQARRARWVVAGPRAAASVELVLELVNPGPLTGAMNTTKARFDHLAVRLDAVGFRGLWVATSASSQPPRDESDISACPTFRPVWRHASISDTRRVH